MTDARCTRCSEKQVGLIDIFQAGHGDRYQVLKLASKFYFLDILMQKKKIH